MRLPRRHADGNSNLSKVLAISQVNRRRAVGDRKVLFVAAALPIMLILVIGFVSGRDVRAPLGIVEVDHGPISTRLVTLLESFSTLQVLTRSGNTAAFQTQVAVSGAYDIVVSEWQTAEHLAATTGTSTAAAF